MIRHTLRGTEAISLFQQLFTMREHWGVPKNRSIKAINKIFWRLHTCFHYSTKVDFEVNRSKLTIYTTVSFIHGFWNYNDTKSRSIIKTMWELVKNRVTGSTYGYLHQNLQDWISILLKCYSPNYDDKLLIWTICRITKFFKFLDIFYLQDYLELGIQLTIFS